ncbi:MlaC/ttg2D family ABC transporter substrate-binding protein [Flavimaricola marinus]|uniref:Toluene tolerance, Ttg2 n=1 Tax=Flavimaricola marinus TaxID=1819565 RepID=A0A238LFK6_9RHOB|nr:ABC transporter substrate-binding protein [Flavimaricola marinus]SMY08398.1 Toluene tolerance, Ttg2 [Flavimaricola marinus]
MTHSFTRRHFMGTGLALGASLGTTLGTPALAITQSAARSHVDGLVAEVNAVISSGASEAQMLRRFEQIFDRYADVPTIAAYVLGVERRNATPAQLTAFTNAYKTYVARKYGRRFREFIGGQIEVRGVRDLPRGVEVQTMAVLVGQSPFEVDFHVEDSRGRPLFFNIVIEGINMLLSERAEVLAMLDARGGDLNRLIAELPQT